MKNKEDTESTETKRDPLTAKVTGCAIKVHRKLGPGLLESTYQKCLTYELKISGIDFKVEAPMPVTYKEVNLNCDYRVDIFVEDYFIIELKFVKNLIPLYEAQLLTYMKLAEAPIGLLLNFNVRMLRDGIKRLSLF